MNRFTVLGLAVFGALFVACGGGAATTTPSNGDYASAQIDTPDPKGRSLPTCQGTQPLNKEQIEAILTDLSYKPGSVHPVCAGKTATEGDFVRAYAIANIQTQYEKAPSEKKCAYSLNQTDSGWHADWTIDCVPTERQAASDTATRTAADQAKADSLKKAWAAGTATAKAESESLASKLTLSGTTMTLRQPRSTWDSVERTPFDISVTMANASQYHVTVDLEFVIALADGSKLDLTASNECGDAFAFLNLNPGESRSAQVCPNVGRVVDPTDAKLLQALVILHSKSD